ncbi:hypothetical protein BU17DRAFT_66578 [Hysterangium stoloniferum]|nr:hypothetical protein BU17DRAFT_66578 [Hysterangium stoloniferum]
MSMLFDVARKVGPSPLYLRQQFNIRINVPSDEKNAPLLFHYAKLPTVIVGLAQEYLSDDWLSSIPSSPLLSFLLWNLWLVSSHSLLMGEDQSILNKFQDSLFPCAISAWLFPDYPPSISPPPSDLRRPTAIAPSLSYTINLFSRSVTFTAPPPTPAAILSSCPRSDAVLLRFAQSAAAAANPSFAPSEESVARSERFLASSVANLLQEEPIALIPGLDVLRRPSARFDDDWARLQMTHPGPGHVRTPPVTNDIRPLLAAISGIWEGRMEYPTYGQYMGLRESGTPLISAYESLFITSLPLTARLRVYYCVDESFKLRVPGGRDSILHACLPREEEMNITLTNGGDLRISDRIEGTHARYLLYDPLRDVILMGNTLSPNAGLDAQYIGRLNMTNGLIILLRHGPQLGGELLRGFIHHNQNFVGRWRTTTPPAEADNWEGPFLMGRRSEETIIS